MKTIVLLLALAPAALAADVSGRFEPGTKYEAPAAHAPANVSRMFARTLPRTGANASVDLPAAGGSGMIIWTIPARRNVNGRAVTTRLTAPTGAMLQPDDRGSIERGMRRFEVDGAETAELGLPAGKHEVLHVMRTEAATYRVDVEMPEDVAGVMVVAAEPDSAITMSTWAAPLSRQPHEPVTLHAELRDGDTAIGAATVTARLASPDGKTFDAIALHEVSSGVYEATLAELPDATAGAWQVRFEAEGAGFARTGSAELVAERGAAHLRDVQTEVVGDVLRISIPADIAVAGSYRLDAIVARNGESIAWAQGVRALQSGATTLTIDVPATDADFVDVRLLDLGSMGVAGRITR